MPRYPFVPGRRDGRRVLPGLLAICAFAIAVPATAEAATGFLPPTPVSGTAATFSNLEVATNSNGDTVASWLQAGALMTSTRPAGGSFSSAQPTTVSGSTLSTPHVAIDDAGGRYLVFNGVASGANQPYVAYAPPGAQFGTPVPLDTITGDVASVPQISVNPGGKAVAVWVFSAVGISTNNVRYATTTGAGTFGPATNINGTNEGSSPRVDVGQGGTAAAIWQVGVSTASGAVMQPASTSFGGATPLSGVTNAAVDDVAVDAAGNVTAAYHQAITFNGGEFSTWAAPSGPWVPGPAFGTNISGLQVEADSAGDTSMFYVDGGAGHYLYRGPAGGGFTNQTIPAATTSVAAPTLAMGASGQVLAAWTDNQGGNSPYVGAASGGPNAALSVLGPITPIVAGSGASAPFVAIGPSGDGAAIFSQPVSGGSQATVRGFDGAPPALSNVSIPPAGTPNQTLTFSASAFDNWGLQFTGWDFGDGTTATGLTVTHAYGTPLVYTAKVTATDLVGNSTTQSGSVDIAEPPPPPPPGPTPTEGVSVVGGPVSGTTYYTMPKGAGNAKAMAGVVAARVPSGLKPPKGYTNWRRLKSTLELPVNSLFDTTKSTMKLTSAGDKTASTLYTANFKLGAFKVSQKKTSSLTTLTMTGSENFSRGCRSSSSIRKSSADATAAASRPRRRLSGSGSGKFRTRGRHSTATVRGTNWTMNDTCSGTQTVVKSGVVQVFDLTKRKNVTLRAGQKYLARPKKR